MKAQRYRTTICGERASKRVRWFNPKGFVKKDGKTYVPAFVVVAISHEGFKLVAVSSQYGTDHRGRHVLPKNVHVDESGYEADQELGLSKRIRTACYHVGLPIGELQESAEQLVASFNKQLEPSGTTGFSFAECDSVNFRTINEVKVTQ